MSKLYPCQIPGCDKEVAIRSTLKTGDFKGKRVCSFCKNKYEPKVFKPAKPLKSFSKKTLEKRRIERAGLPEFYHSKIMEMKLRPMCENCGGKIITWLHPVNNIAHILKKETYKSVMTDSNNYLFLCSGKDNTGNDCHYKFDNEIEKRPTMPVFKKAVSRYLLFQKNCLEMGKERLIYDKS